MNYPQIPKLLRWRPLTAGKLSTLAMAAWCASVELSHAQLGYDPFAGNPAHGEARWASYTDATTNGTNRPNGTPAVSGLATSAASFNLAVTGGAGAFLIRRPAPAASTASRRRSR